MFDFKAIIKGRTVSLEHHDEPTNTLALRLTDNGDTCIGFLVFSGVSFVQMAPSVTVHGAGVYDHPCPNFLSVPLEDAEFQFVFGGPDGAAHCIVARSVEYKEAT